MDAIANLLEGTRARGAFSLRCVMSPPWGLRIVAQSPVTLIAAVKGELWVMPDKGDPLHIAPGGVAVTRAPDHYNVVGAIDTEPEIVIHPQQHCCDLEGNSVLEEMTHGVRTWGNDPKGECVFIVGAYEHLSTVSDRLEKILPPALALSKEDWDSPLLSILVTEVGKDEPGQAAVLDRLLDLLLTAVLKAWAGKQDSERPVWWQSQGDPIVERALQLIHKDPAYAWTLDKLAAKTNASRASLARRFNDIVGEPPMTFLKNWRMALAEDLLRRPEETVGTVSEKIGYKSPFAFSAAFKRIKGESPYEYRARAR
ncbi:AraC family transcriptional regulator [Hyphococcus flavus]|uniref:AraC family transcriptional regulator n=1 Tax=Hyphococcus flavus TaxID=1866326 RepID=A0AAE9Z9V2_9PROT|nr:AraC family transcriptional regulator [Hyphococcus flavus]WDI30098.1 AraC family transcriptional regulator [Hyphococcus flavus]